MLEEVKKRLNQNLRNLHLPTIRQCYEHPDARRCVNVQPRCHLHAEPTHNHQGLGNALLEAEECVGSPHGKVRCRKRLGGLLSYYHRDAA